MLNLDRLNPLSIIAGTQIATWFWFSTTCVATVVAVTSPYLTIQVLKQKERVIVLGENEILYTRLDSWDEAEELHEYCAKRALEAAFMRHPNGPDYPELLERMFISDARTQVKAYHEATRNQFLARQIHQKVELVELKIVDAGPTKGKDGRMLQALQAHARVQLLRTIVDQGIAYPDQPQILNVDFTMVRNTRLLDNGLMPLVVAKFEWKESAP